MKHLITLSFILLSIIAFAQTEIKAQLTPNRVYEISFKGYANNSMTLVGKSPVALLQLQAAGIQLPLEVTEITTVKAIANTGSPNTSNQTPLTYKYLQSTFKAQANQALEGLTSDDEGINALAGQKLSGYISNKGKIHIDSITDNKLVENGPSRYEMINIFKLPQLNGKKLEIGKTISTNEAMVIASIADENVTVNRKIIYKLNDVKENKAYFDVTQQVSGAFRTAFSPNSRAMGEGTGKLVIDLSKSMPIEYSNNLNIKIIIPFTPTDTVEITCKMLSNSIVKID